MAEAVGIAAAVLQMATTGMQLSMTIHGIGANMANAGVQIYAVAQGVQLFSQTLRHVGLVLRQCDSIHSRGAEDTAREIITQCRAVFDEIEMMISQVHTMGRVEPLGLIMRVKWCFKKAKVEYLVGKLDTLKLTLSLMLQAISTAKIMAMLEQASNQSLAEQEQVVQEKDELHSWVITRHWSLIRLSRLYYAAVQEYEEEMPTSNGCQGGSNGHRLTLSGEDISDYSALQPFKEDTMGNLDTSMASIVDSSKQLIPRSASMIDYLLRKWTRLEDIRAQVRSASRGRDQSQPGLPRQGQNSDYGFQGAQQRSARVRVESQPRSARSASRSQRGPQDRGTKNTRPSSVKNDRRPRPAPQGNDHLSRARHHWKEHERRPIPWRRGSGRAGAWRQFLNEKLQAYEVPNSAGKEINRASFGKDTWTEISDDWVLAEALELWQYPFDTYDKLFTEYARDKAGDPVGEGTRFKQKIHRIGNALDFGEILDLVELSDGILRYRERPDRSTPSVLSTKRPRRPNRVNELEYPFVPEPRKPKQPLNIRIARFIVPWHRA